jgi:hypothetical protein
MSTYTRSASNGVSFGTLVTASATDQSDGSIIFDFQTAYNLVAAITVTNALNEVINPHDMVITYPAVGQVKVANGNSLFTITSGYIFHVIAQRRKAT